MKLRNKSAVAAAGLMAMSMVAAPMVTATEAQARPVCEQTATKTRCETNGSTSIKVVPQTRAPMSGQQMGALGMVPRQIFLGW
ncbi:hypothetical protein [Mycolicibacterium brumae]|uniref:Uncharacterized protein n=1 Tax=Mycolicibacterium brumae TaxID=85968 RepID=A0A2G5PEW7_9MYCO|nr:hypothetical protein [Mycolicibacterium brumae]MCV7191941.1 hypothetical protein [Mycolicibacterium brumae]PIB76846.1 hypothetical protein CQY22_004170 [Mycolicibacterium brumae]RWA20612.1 hypothetical protein MBRU_02835 [Mycolicibacterium brumae DSM 44177]UWW07710.1 hypothetical protein L2Z93_000737 [Mycolicibacterium brumae]